MSRTYRVKQEIPWNPYLRKGETIMRYLHRYHGDRPSGFRNAPKWFRQDLNRNFRTKNRMKLIQALKEDQEFVEIPFVHNANWNWW